MNKELIEKHNTAIDQADKMLAEIEDLNITLSRNSKNIEEMEVCEFWQMPFGMVADGSQYIDINAVIPNCMKFVQTLFKKETPAIYFKDSYAFPKFNLKEHNLTSFRCRLYIDFLRGYFNNIDEYATEQIHAMLKCMAPHEKISRQQEFKSIIDWPMRGNRTLVIYAGWGEEDKKARLNAIITYIQMILDKRTPSTATRENLQLTKAYQHRPDYDKIECIYVYANGRAAIKFKNEKDALEIREALWAKYLERFDDSN